LKQIPIHNIAYDSYGDIWGESTPQPSKHKKTIEISPTEVGMPVLESMPTAVITNKDVYPIDGKRSGAQQERRWSSQDLSDGKPIVSPSDKRRWSEVKPVVPVSVLEKECQWSNDKLVVPLSDKSSEIQQERRWSAEVVKPLSEEVTLLNGVEEGFEIPLEGKIECDEIIDTEVELKDEMRSPMKMKRRGSNDRLPTKPNRRGSNPNRPSQEHGTDVTRRINRLVGYAKRQNSIEYSELSKKGDSILFERSASDIT
jgi:hypothetical protein